MQMIEAARLTKTFRRMEKDPGLKGSVKSLFHRTYAEKTALSEFDLAVSQGEFVGLIGPNGAGKTTLVKLLSGIIAPTSGDLRVLGHIPNRLENSFKQQYALVMGQKSQLFFELTARDTFRLFKELYSIPETEYAKSLSYFVDLFAVGSLMDAQVRTLSLGERMKMELIAALLHGPRLLFLDEPTIGLDALAQEQMRTFLKEVNREKGTTILLTSHYMEDIVSLCQRCVVVNSGKKLLDGPTQELFEQFRTQRKITLSLKEAFPLELPPQCEVLTREPLRLSFLAPKEQAAGLMHSLLTRCPVGDITVEDEDIASVVARLYGMEAQA